MVSAGLALMLGAAMLWAPGSKLNERIQRQGSASSADPYFDFRLGIWRASLKASLARPLAGSGLGSYQRAMSAWPLELRPGVERLTLEHAHNSWLELAFELGWPAAIALFCAAFYLFARWFTKGPSLQDSALESALLALLVHAFFDFEYSTPWCWVLGIALLAARESAPQQGGGLSARLRPAYALAGSLLFCGALGQWLELRGAKMEHTCDESCFESAIALRPYSAQAAARQALLDQACFDKGQNPRGLFKAARELAFSLQLDPGHSGARVLLAQLLTEAASRLPEEALNRLGNLMPGWQELIETHPNSSASQKIQLLALTVQAK